ncbi:MAG: sigma-70 family RNA polymerase sigma factor [Acidobacteriota bacterium]
MPKPFAAQTAQPALPEATAGDRSMVNTGIETRPESIEALWQAYYSELLSFARSRLASSPEAEDVLQLAFLRAYNQIRSGARPTNPRAWLYQIVRNLVVDVYRKNTRSKEDPNIEAGRIPEPIDERNPPGVESDASAIVARALPIFIERLRSPYREALQLTDIEGLTQAEAALRAGVSLSGMKSRVQRARKQLYVSLHECCEFGLDSRNRIVSCEPHGEERCCAGKPQDDGCGEIAGIGDSSRT